jgi:hypothetical protein
MTQKNVPIVATFVLGLFGLFGIEASEEQVLAVINGALMLGTAVWAIWVQNREK